MNIDLTYIIALKSSALAKNLSCVLNEPAALPWQLAHATRKKLQIKHTL
jgi:hypothetical protein